MQVQVGEIYDGKITGVKKFGAFVRLECGTTGMVHISEVSTGFIEELADVLHEGQQVQVKVVSVAEDGKVALSMKQTAAAPVAAPPRPTRGDPGKVWQPKPPKPAGNTFEDMMSRFKSQSEERISDLRRATEGRRGSGGYSRRR